MSSYRYVVFGVGQNGQYACRMLLDAGARIAAVYSRTSQLGRDVGELLGRGPVGVTVQPVAEFEPSREVADIALFCTTSLISDLMGDARRCLAAGIRVLTIAEDAAYPWIHAPELASELDVVAKAAGSALLSSGMNDVPMVHLPLGLASMSRSVRRISCAATGNFGRQGAATLLHLGIGGTLEAFEQLMSAEPEPGVPVPASISETVAQAMAAAMGLKVHSADVQISPVIAARALPVPSLGSTIPAGAVRGIRERAELVTDGPRLEVELIGQVFDEGDEERCTAHVDGYPSLTSSLSPRSCDGEPNPSGGLPGFTEATVAIALNRVPELMAAAPGLLSIDRLPGARYWPGL